jgi:hypothetical protein
LLQQRSEEHALAHITGIKLDSFIRGAHDTSPILSLRLHTRPVYFSGNGRPHASRMACDALGF